MTNGRRFASSLHAHWVRGCASASERFDATESVTVCPFTTTEVAAPRLRLPVVADEANGLDQDSYQMIDNVTTVEKSNAHPVVGRLEAARLFEFERRRLVFLGFGA